MNKKFSEYNEDEKAGFNSGYVNALSGIYHGLDDDEREKFEAMVNKTVGKNDASLMKDAIKEKDNDSSCPPGCTCTRAGMICNGKFTHH